jgi:hypothetical protein
MPIGTSRLPEGGSGTVGLQLRRPLQDGPGHNCCRKIGFLANANAVPCDPKLPLSSERVEPTGKTPTMIFVLQWPMKASFDHRKGLLQGLLFWSLVVFLLLGPSTSWCEGFPEAVRKPVEKSIDVRRATQQAADRWEEERKQLADRYDRLVRKRDDLARRRDRLHRAVEGRKAAVVSLERQRIETERIIGGIRPYLERIYQRLSERVQTDLPFLLQERRNRLARLREILNDDRVPDSEKFRKTMEALLVEAEYGNTVEVYRQPIDLNGREVLTDVFRLGRISLFFQTLDGSEAGFFDPSSKSWRTLPPKTHRTIAAVMEMGSRHRSVDLLPLPIGRLNVP